jgi:MOSC domain-containing protein YiiM
MKLISVSVALPRSMPWKGHTVTTGIFKSPVKRRVRLNILNLEGDGQADLSVHGGTAKAVYLYPSEHYDYWRNEKIAVALPHGSFGENFTTIGLLEDTVHVGDQFRIGTAEVVVTQPRLPCLKLGIKFGDPAMVKRFAESRRTGFYLAVRREGEVGAGDFINLVSRDPNRVTVADITRLYLGNEEDRPTMERAVRVSALPANWREYFQDRIYGRKKKDIEA